MKKLLVILILAYLAYGYIQGNPDLVPADFSGGSQDNQQLISAFENQQSDVQVSGTGTVVRTLADDTQGSRHQRFILRISPNPTILVAHNIDLAPRINALNQGDTVSFYGEYEWNSQGGVLHWTHHDPGGRHQDGWLKHNGRTYQ